MGLHYRPESEIVTFLLKLSILKPTLLTEVYKGFLKLSQTVKTGTVLGCIGLVINGFDHFSVNFTVFNDFPCSPVRNETRSKPAVNPQNTPEYSRILQDSPRFSKILKNTPRFSKILQDSPQQFWHQKTAVLSVETHPDPYHGAPPGYRPPLPGYQPPTGRSPIHGDTMPGSTLGGQKWFTRLVFETIYRTLVVFYRPVHCVHCVRCCLKCQKG